MPTVGSRLFRGGFRLTVPSAWTLYATACPQPVVSRVKNTYILNKWISDRVGTARSSRGGDKHAVSLAGRHGRTRRLYVKLLWRSIIRTVPAVH